MKKNNIFKFVFILASVYFFVLTLRINITNKKEHTDVTLANIEALADESSNGTKWCCSKMRPYSGYKALFCDDCVIYNNYLGSEYYSKCP